MEFLHSELTERIIGVYHDVYSELGYGFLEKLYQRAMTIALREAGLSVSRDTRFDVMFRGHCLGQFFADLIVENRVLLEIKATSALQPSDEAQVLNYLRASTIELALLLNFGPKRELKRRVLTNDRKGASPRIDSEP
ncbi:MAG TPA: GxxExxY protein [Vicinamibacterales bacterium]|jgi:GxxExxY protein